MNDKVEITENTKEKLENANIDLSNQNNSDLIEKINESNIAVARMNDEEKIVIKVTKSEKEKIFAAIAYSFYRSAYSSSKELLKYEISSKERRRRIKDVCRAFCNEKVPTKNFKTFVISLPIRLKTAFLIDKAIRLKK